MARINVDIPDDLKRKAKVKAAEEQRTLTEVIEQLLEQWVRVRRTRERRRRLILGTYNLGATGSFSRREIYEDLR
jgi:ribbon-helix-helix CopG family protein